MKITKSEILNFILNGEILGFKLGDNKDYLIKKIGTPIHYEPQKKRNKGILNYGKLNVYIYNDTVSSFSFNDLLEYSNLELCKIILSEITEFLEKNKIHFNLKKSKDINELDFIFFKNYQLGFSDDSLCYFWIEALA
ncbi:hypothetical protein [Mannheimia massilioguelmaensis]|uniref:hypothetical protein n=1 Tax=Mannheimia massilioguelmaensis TaxID=1604354 RepID=UPI0005C8D311|nr:hypothetical protein [Mannheimia massilioguelmaensis]